MTEVKIKGLPKVIEYQNDDKVLIELTFETPASSEFIFWFKNPTTDNQGDTLLTVQACNVKSDMIQFWTTKAASRGHIKMVQAWIGLANDYVQGEKLKRQKYLETQDERKKKGQALQEELKDVFD